MALTLKNYQTRALRALEAFLMGARGASDQPGLQAAFDAARVAALGDSAPSLVYRPLAGDLQSVPQACLRIPTGGGKTLLAAHAIETAARVYVGTQAPLTLWLVPSNTIRSQTIEALKKPDHPYRQALLAHYPADRLTVIDIAECESLRAQDFGSRAIVAVGTIQTLRVDQTASRDVYSYKEAFESHFADIPVDADYLERIKEADLLAQPYLKHSDLGKVKRSFANLLAFYRPIVIVDEAHNAQSDLSFEVLKRVRPACVLEWTATPARDQNVLYHVSAQELKAESMIKLPIVLAPHPNWQEAVRDAVLTRERLAAEATNEPDYVRPIVVFQADAKDGEVPVETLKNYLTAERGIAANRIAVATGTQRELDGLNLFDRSCLIDFVITVEALKEGWDCSFAYVFCTVQRIRSAKDMEQLLGRVLRLPYATRRQSELLNRAYAHVCSPQTAEVANDLADRLVSMGFEQIEAATAVQPALGDDLFAVQTAPTAVSSTLALPPAVADALAVAAASSVQVERTAETTSATITGVLPQAAIDAAVAAAPRKEQEGVRSRLERHQAQAQAAAAPAERGAAFAEIPRLAVHVQGSLQLLEPDLLGELASFSLTGQPAELPGFTKAADPRPYLIDINGARLRIEQDRSAYQLDLNTGHDGISRATLLRALDGRVRRGDLLQADKIAWLGRVVDWLESQGIELAYQARHLNQLGDALAKRIELLAQQNRKAAFQQVLFGTGTEKASIAAHLGFRFDPTSYPARWFFNGRFVFQRHYYPRPGELDDDLTAEETACAIELDSMPEVRHWIRNLSQQPLSSFWLPTSTDRFYPDFVAELTDGRLFVVEYKGAIYYDNDDSREKRDIGSVWQSASGGRCMFAMPTSAAKAGKPISVQLRDALTASH